MIQFESIWLSYFSTGLKPPPRKWLISPSCFLRIGCLRYSKWDYNPSLGDLSCFGDFGILLDVFLNVWAVLLCIKNIQKWDFPIKLLMIFSVMFHHKKDHRKLTKKAHGKWSVHPMFRGSLFIWVRRMPGCLGDLLGWNPTQLCGDYKKSPLNNQ